MKYRKYPCIHCGKKVAVLPDKGQDKWSDYVYLYPHKCVAGSWFIGYWKKAEY